MSARDVMISAGLPHYSEGGCIGLDEFERREVVESIIDAAISALTSSGYRILVKDEIDAVTVEKCAEMAEDVKSWRHIDADFEANQIATAIRALCATHQGDKE